jgi:plastocyanin
MAASRAVEAIEVVRPHVCLTSVDPREGPVRRGLTIVIGLTLIMSAPTIADAARGPGPRDRIATAGHVARIRIVDFRLRPATITISRGDVVRWKNRGSVAHTSTSSAWDSGRIAPGGTFRRRFARAGTFDYHCTIHARMTGTVVVG